MPRISNVYLSKKTGKFYFVDSLWYNEKGKRVQYFKRGFKTQKEAKNAYEYFIGEPKTNASIRTIAIDHDTTKLF